MQTIKTSAVTYSVRQTSGRWAKRHMVCATAELQQRLAALRARSDVRNVTALEEV